MNETFLDYMSPQQLRERFELLAADAKEYAIFQVGKDGRLICWSSGAERLFGYQANEIIGQPISRFHAPEDHLTGQPKHELKTALESGRSESVCRQIRKNGTGFWCRATVTPLVDGQKEVQSFAWVMHDLTESPPLDAQTQREQAASRESEVRYRRLFESARDGILILDEKTGKIIDANPFMSELLGYDHAEFLGKELWEIGVFSDIAANQAAFQELQTKGFIRYHHLPLQTQDRSTVDVEFVSNVYESDGTLVIQCNIRDCSERFRLERSVAASLQEKEVLLKEVHHRVKNNLQVISSLLHLQSQHTQDDLSVQMFRQSQDRVRSMAMVHERLYRTKDLSQVNFTDYIESLATHLFSAHQVDVDRIKLKLDVDEGRLSIDAAIPCGLILNELISNCLKHAFREKDRGEIRIAMRRLSGSETLLSVSDDGVGLPVGVEPNSAATFGMQLIGDLVNQLHGDMLVTSASGTTFRLVFPSETAKSNPKRKITHER